MQCFWKVKVVTNKGNSEWSETAMWSVGLLSKADWKATWIGYDKASPWDSLTTWSRLSARYLRKEFTSPKIIRKATIYISGLGLYEMYMNGKKVDDRVMAPLPTDYRQSVLYNTYDVTNDLQKGNNAIGIVLGNGRFFTMRQNYKPAKINNFGFPKLLFQLEIVYSDGTKNLVVSDNTWKLNVDGPIRTNNEYDGEEYDATKELGNWSNAGFDDAKWMNALKVNAPAGKLTAQMTSPIRIMRRIQPVNIREVAGGNYIMDLGQNFSGVLRMKVKGARGQKVLLRFAESLKPTGELYVANLRDAKVTDMYTLKGGEVETWQPSFVFHGFRYVEIQGFPGKASVENFEGEMIYDEMDNTGSFTCSDSVINGIVRNAWWGIASNYKGMPIDCPQRNERQPWLGDRATGSGGESFLFNNQALYAKWLDDIEQSQLPGGAIPDVAPAFWNYYSDNMTWPGTYILVADMLYRQFGNKEVITSHYASMKKWIQYMEGKYLDHSLMTKDKYGDWCVPPESLELIRSKDSLRNTNGTLIATAYYYMLLQKMKGFAELSGHTSDIKVYDERANKSRVAFNRKFFNPKKNSYDNNSVTANLLPLYFNMAPDSLREAIFNNIYSRIRIADSMHISTGVIGTQWLMRGLTKFRRSDIAFNLASNNSYPSWGYMLRNNATTIWELWNGNTANPQMNSQNHVMLLGDLLIWLFEDLGGIKSDNKEVGFKKIIMKPENIDGLFFVNAKYQSSYGTIVSEWKKDESRTIFTWRISIPANTTALVYVPAENEKDVLESGKPVITNAEIKLIRMDDRCAVIQIGSGNYSFESQFPSRNGIVKDEFIFQHASFPESHAATIAETPGGLIASWFGGTKEGNKDVCIWTSRLINDHWTEPVKVADGRINDSTRYACYNPVLYQVPGGDLLLFYKIGPNVAGWTGWMMRSHDHGITWSTREKLPEGFLGPIKNKPVLINGKLVCPSSTEKDGWKVHFEITTDEGRTWTKSDDINDGKIISAIQPSILTYTDGRLQVLCRSKNTTLNQSWSSDGGKSWSAMTASGLPNNNSGTDAVTLSNGTQLLVYNHVKPTPSMANGKGPRTPLNVAVSKDGIKWYAAVVLEDSPINQYSYPSVIQGSDGMIHIVYTWRRERIKYVKIDPSKLEWKEIVNGAWPGMNPNIAMKASDD